MKVTAYYLTGNYQTIDTTVQTLQDGVLLDDAFLDANDLENDGLLLTRATYNNDAEGRQAVAHAENIVIISPEELENIGYITVDGQPFLLRTGEGLEFKRCIIEALENLSVGESGETEPEGEEYE